MKRFKGQEQRGYKKKMDDEVRIAGQIGRCSLCLISRKVLSWYEDNLYLLIMDEPRCFDMSVILSAADSPHNSSPLSC